MIRFFTYAEHYVDLNATEANFIKQHGRIRTYKKNDYYVMTGETRRNWCFVLQGLVAGVRYNHGHEQDLIWVAPPYDYFTGTKHTFSDSTADMDIQMLRPSELLELPLTHVRTARQQFPQLAEFFQILLHKQLLFAQNMLRIQKTNDGTHRYVEFRRRLPELERLLTMHETCSLLNIGLSTYKRGQQLFFKF